MMTKVLRASGVITMAALLAGCAADDGRQADVTAETVPRVNRVASPDEQRREELYSQLFQQIEPCLTEQLERVNDPTAAGPVVVQFSFTPAGEAEAAQLPQGGEARYEDDVAYRELVNAILLGVKDCSPLQDMPTAEHDVWGVFPLVYQPAEAQAS